MLWSEVQSVEWRLSPTTSIFMDPSVRFRTILTSNVADSMNKDFWMMLNNMLKPIKLNGSLMNPGETLFQYNFESVIMTILLILFVRVF